MSFGPAYACSELEKSIVADYPVRYYDRASFWRETLAGQRMEAAALALGRSVWFGRVEANFLRVRARTRPYPTCPKVPLALICRGRRRSTRSKERLRAA